MRFHIQCRFSLYLNLPNCFICYVQSKYWIEGRSAGHRFEIGPSKDHSSQVWFNSGHRFEIGSSKDHSSQVWFNLEINQICTSNGYAKDIYRNLLAKLGEN